MTSTPQTSAQQTQVMGARLTLSRDEDECRALCVRKRRARKRHSCHPALRQSALPVRRWDGGPLPSGHTPWIEPGDDYIEYYGEADLYHAGSRMCAACAIACGLAVAVEEDQGDTELAGSLTPLATILHNGDHRDDDNPRRVELALGPDGDVWGRDPGGEWYPTGTSRDETPDSVLDVIATAWRGPNWDLEWLEQE